PRVSLTTLVQHVVDGGVPEWRDARTAVAAVLRVLGERLTDDEAITLAHALPVELERTLEQARYAGDFDADELHARVARAAEVPIGTARERTSIVLRSLGELLEHDVVVRLARALPDGIAHQLEPPELGPAPPHLAARPAPRATLATGRPGSRHPLAEGAPPSGHTHSIARNDDPHAETKLSSARGLTQERLGETLATGHPARSS
ncbi:MAG TPA: DUF2267 domain-containing protein, partial [Labilithrix sp.]|nr:DUF2267 domain-containing protein [Labilithrix sp.]